MNDGATEDSVVLRCISNIAKQNIMMKTEFFLLEITFWGAVCSSIEGSGVSLLLQELIMTKEEEEELGAVPSFATLVTSGIFFSLFISSSLFLYFPLVWVVGWQEQQWYLLTTRLLWALRHWCVNLFSVLQWTVLCICTLLVLSMVKGLQTHLPRVLKCWFPSQACRSSLWECSTSPAHLWPWVRVLHLQFKHWWHYPSNDGETSDNVPVMLPVLSFRQKLNFIEAQCCLGR